MLLLTLGSSVTAERRRCVPCAWMVLSRSPGVWVSEESVVAYQKPRRNLAAGSSLSCASLCHGAQGRPWTRTEGEASGGSCGSLWGPVCRTAHLEGPGATDLDHGAILCQSLVIASSSSAPSGGGTRPARLPSLVSQRCPHSGAGPRAGRQHDPSPFQYTPPCPASSCPRLPLACSFFKQAAA